MSTKKAVRRGKTAPRTKTKTLATKSQKAKRVTQTTLASQRAKVGARKAVVGNPHLKSQPSLHSHSMQTQTAPIDSADSAKDPEANKAFVRPRVIPLAELGLEGCKARSSHYLPNGQRDSITALFGGDCLVIYGPYQNRHRPHPATDAGGESDDKLQPHN